MQHSCQIDVPGDVTPDGDVLRPPWGHYTEDWKPDSFDVQQFFMSPSIVYAGKEAYSTKEMSVLRFFNRVV